MNNRHRPEAGIQPVPSLNLVRIPLSISNKMQETRTKMPVARVYLLENLHFMQFFVEDSVPGSIIIGRRR